MHIDETLVATIIFNFPSTEMDHVDMNGHVQRAAVSREAQTLEARLSVHYGTGEEWTQTLFYAVRNGEEVSLDYLNHRYFFMPLTVNREYHSEYALTSFTIRGRLLRVTSIETAPATPSATSRTRRSNVGSEAAKALAAYRYRGATDTQKEESRHFLANKPRSIDV